MASEDVNMRSVAFEGMSLTTFGDGLGMPPERQYPRVHERFEPLDHVDSRLAGCVWEVVACVVPPTKDRPEYPHMRFRGPTRAVTAQWQVWWWVTWRPPAFPRAVMLWHPARGVTWNIADLSPADGRETVLRVWRWQKVVAGFSKRGRALSTASDRPSLEAIHLAVRQIRGRGDEPTQERVLEALGTQAGPRQLYRWLEDYGTSWAAIKRG